MTLSSQFQRHIGHVIDKLRALPAGAAQCVVTSPPYFGLRDYGLNPVIWEPMAGLSPLQVPPQASPVAFAGCEHDWGDWAQSRDVREASLHGKTRTTARFYRDESRRYAHGHFCRICGAWRGCLGLEPDPNLYVGHLVQVFREVRRVLADDGVCWLNLGDSYARDGGTDAKAPATAVVGNTRDTLEQISTRKQRPPGGLKAKDLVGIPWRVALALQADGWFLRSDIVWAKGNAMPESATDRPTRSHEFIFLLSKRARYFFDHHAIREPASGNAKIASSSFKRPAGNKREQGLPGRGCGTHRPDRPDVAYAGEMRNKRDVWTVNTRPYRGAHFAVFPPDLIEPMILAGTSARGHCPQCGERWMPATQHRRALPSGATVGGCPDRRDGGVRERAPSGSGGGNILATVRLGTGGWRAGCACGAEAVPDAVLDPFGGSGTTAQVAGELGRAAILIEANVAYVPMQDKRLASAAQGGRSSKRLDRAPKEQPTVPAEAGGIRLQPSLFESLECVA